MTEDKIINDAASSIAEALIVIPLGAASLALNGWWGVLVLCVFWVLAGLAKGAFRFWRLKREYE